MVYSSGSQPFWHQGPVSWKTIFPRTGGGGYGSGGNASNGEQQMKLRSPEAHLLLCGQVPNRPRYLGIGDPWFIVYTDRHTNVKLLSLIV